MNERMLCPHFSILSKLMKHHCYFCDCPVIASGMKPHPIPSIFLPPPLRQKAQIPRNTHIIILNMICFGTNFEFGFDWQLAYSQLLTLYNQLSSDYQRSLELGRDLQLKVATITKENEELRAGKIPKSFQTVPNVSASLLPAHLPSQEEITIRSAGKRIARLKRQQSISTSEAVQYECVYEGCGRVYKSSVSMNLHIKNKHNGGTKKEREQHAKAIIDAQINGEEPPVPPICFPPNFLEEFRTTYEYMKKYSM